MDQLLDLVDKNSMLGLAKLRLQDLTANDMDIYIRTTLEYTRIQCLPTSVEDEHLESVVREIAQKADGVFLWVHCALGSLVTGMRKEDTFEDLLRRIELLPSGMHQLFLQMWSRLNEDKQLHQAEAATYFSYAAEISEERLPLSSFELLVALDPQSQETIVDDLTPQGSVRLSHDCEVLKTRVLTRTAGLLDFSVDEKEDSVSSEWTESSEFTEGVEEKAFLVSSSSKESYQSWHDPAVDGDVTSIVQTEAGEGDYQRASRSHVDSTLTSYFKSRLKYLHRTA
ncbi:MAG: hypothetical protein Q9199_000651 [Rusavskia elegans]